MKYLFKGVTAYVEVKINEQDRSSCVRSRLISMGATITKRLSKRCTHVIFKDGLCSTYNKAKKLGLYIASVSWIEACRKEGIRLAEVDYPCCNRKNYENPGCLQNSGQVATSTSKEKTNLEKSKNLKLKQKTKTTTKAFSKAITQKYPLLLKNTKRNPQGYYTSNKSKSSNLIQSLFSTPNETGEKPKNTKHCPQDLNADMFAFDSSSQDTISSTSLKHTSLNSKGSRDDKEKKYYTSEFKGNSAHDKNLGIHKTNKEIVNPTENHNSNCTLELGLETEDTLENNQSQQPVVYTPDSFTSSTSTLDSMEPATPKISSFTSNQTEINNVKMRLSEDDINVTTSANQKSIAKTDDEKSGKITKATQLKCSHHRNAKVSANIVKEIKSICLKILEKPPNYNINKIIMESRKNNKLIKRKPLANIEADIISNCAKILGYTVQ
jgi:hypothetical protein